MRRTSRAVGVAALLISPAIGAETTLFYEDFSAGLDNWRVGGAFSGGIVDSGDAGHGPVLELRGEGLSYVLIDGSDQWEAVRIEGEMAFPSTADSYLGLVYAFAERDGRVDFASVYLKPDGNYLRVNPWRDGNAGRLLYEEYFRALDASHRIEAGRWYGFKAEVWRNEAHFYFDDMSVPMLTFDLFEYARGSIGFKPRIVGGAVWLDNVHVTAIDALSYKGPRIPDITYERDELLTHWQVLGPYSRPQPAIERSGGAETSEVEIGGRVQRWRDFPTDDRGAVLTGRVTEYEGPRPVAYFRHPLVTESGGIATLSFSTTDELAVWVNDRFYGFVYRNGYVSGDNDWNAWYDFHKNPSHAGRTLQIELQEGINQILVRVRNGEFASGGFYAAVDIPRPHTAAATRSP